MPNIFRVVVTVTGDDREAFNERIRDGRTTNKYGTVIDLGCETHILLNACASDRDSVDFEADKTVINGETWHVPPLYSLEDVSSEFPALKFELFFWDLSNDHYEFWRIQGGAGQLWTSVTLDHNTCDDIGPGTVHFVRDGEPCASEEAIRENHWWDQPVKPFDEDLFKKTWQSRAMPLD